jgi:MtN3 and saliva related transmembrane protein
MSGKIIIDILYAIGLLINAAVFAMQAYSIYKKKTSEQVSLFTFVGFNVLQVFGIINGLIFHDPDLIYGLIPSLITCNILVWTIIYYRRFYKPGEVDACN